jgi:hypothetical protein
MLVDPALFVASMARSWKTYENVSSDAMTEAWNLLVATLNARAAGESDRAAVFAGPLGMGKTLGAITYTAMMPADAGALVVTRTIEQAKDFANQVNSRGGRAFAYHSDLEQEVWNNPDVLIDWPVVVACHRTYEAGLNMAAFEEIDPRFAKLHAYGDGRTRALVAIDEAMPQVLEARVSVASLRALRELIPPGVSLYNRGALHVVAGIEQLLLTDRDVSRPLPDTEMTRWIELSTSEADGALARLGYSVQAYQFKRDQRKTVRKLLNTITAVRALMEDYRWQYVGRSGKTMVTTARMLVPPARSVTLDATGALSPVHVGRPDLFEIVVPKPTRTYWPVVVRVARTPRGTGKEHAERWATSMANRVLTSLRTFYGDRAHERRVLVVTHLVGEKKVERVFKGGGFAETHVAHWNALDGKNLWRECDTVVILTHPYRDPAADMNAHQAINGAAPALQDIREGSRAVREARVAAANAQALGRTRMRKMLTATGECPPVDVWVRAPASRSPMDTDTVLAMVGRTLPGMRLEVWDLDEGADTDDLRRKGAKGDAALLALATGLAVGDRVPLTMGLLRLTHGAFHRLTSAARTAGNPLQVALARLGCIVKKGVGSKTNPVSPTLVRVQTDSLVEEKPPRVRMGRGSRKATAGGGAARRRGRRPPPGRSGPTRVSATFRADFRG